VIALGLLAACGGGVRTEPVEEAAPRVATGGGDGSEPAEPSGAAGGASGGGGASAEMGGRVALDVVPCPGLPLKPSCTGEIMRPDRMPTDLVIVLDQSGAMATALPGSARSRWEGVTAALGEVLAEPDWAPDAAALVFLGGGGTLSVGYPCEVPADVEPVVTFTATADGGDALLDALRDTAPAGFTPLEPALVGALELARERAAKSPPGRATGLVVIAASDPTACDGPAATAAAAAALRDDGVRTYVVGIGDVALEPLDALAAAGGTSLAMRVVDANLELELVNALRATTAPVGACEQELPASPRDIGLDFGEILVTYRPSDGQGRTVPPVSGPEDCTDGGYYFDDPIVPSILRLCPCTCADAMPGRIEVRYKCEPLSDGQ